MSDPKTLKKLQRLKKDSLTDRLLSLLHEKGKTGMEFQELPGLLGTSPAMVRNIMHHLRLQGLLETSPATYRLTLEGKGVVSRIRAERYFGKGCKWFTGTWVPGASKDRPPEICHCHHPENKDPHEGNCVPEYCPRGLK